MNSPPFKFRSRLLATIAVVVLFLGLALGQVLSGASSSSSSSLKAAPISHEETDEAEDQEDQEAEDQEDQEAEDQQDEAEDQQDEAEADEFEAEDEEAEDQQDEAEADEFEAEDEEAEDQQDEAEDEEAEDEEAEEFEAEAEDEEDEGQAPSELRDFGEAENISFDLHLAGARILESDPDDDREEVVQFEFTEELDEIEDEDLFFLVGVEPSDTVQAEDVFRDEEDDTSVIAEFESGLDVTDFALAAVGAGAVVNVEEEENLPDSDPLGGTEDGVEAGETSGPDLADIAVEEDTEQVEFVFDEDLDEESEPDTGDFGFYTEDGEVHTADELAHIDDDEVEVEFDDEEDDVEEAVRFFVTEDAVEDNSGNSNPLGSSSGDTATAELESIDDAPGDTQFDFEFDEDIEDAEADHFVVYTADGQRFEAEEVNRPDGDTVRAIFPDTAIEEAPEEVVLGAVEPGAVVEEGTDSENTIGGDAIDIGGDADEGPTVGPDLESTEINEDTGTVRFEFDADLAEEDEDINAEDFFAVTEAGDLEAGETIVEADENFVIVDFDENATEAAQGVLVAAGAVEDEQGNTNPVGRPDQ